MVLRKLEIQDSKIMYEWMHDKSVVKDLQSDFEKCTLKDCEDFIIKSRKDEKNLHYAIVDNDNVYCGTVSLKNICLESKVAEFAIVLHRHAMGTGIAIRAMQEILQVAKDKLNLELIYWCVSRKNERAVRFYDKNRFERVNIFDYFNRIDGYTKEQMNNYLWYLIKNNRM